MMRYKWAFGLLMVTTLSLSDGFVHAQEDPDYLAAVARTQRSYSIVDPAGYAPLPHVPLRLLPDVPAGTNAPGWVNFGTEVDPDWRVLVTSYTWNYGTWQGRARFDPIDLFWVSGTTTNYISSWVTFNDDLPAYVAATYSNDLPAIIAADAIEEKFYMSLGMPPSDGRVLVQLWVRPADLARPAYNNSRANATIPPVDAQGRYVLVFDADDNVSAGLRLQDDTGQWHLMGTDSFSDFFMNNFATTYPWTAMGYTWNWDPGLGTNDLAHVGVSEFIIGGGAQVYYERTIFNDQLDDIVRGDPVFTITIDGVDFALHYSNTLAQIWAPEPPPGQVFAQWLGDTQYLAEVQYSDTLILMPGADVHLETRYRPDYPGTVAASCSYVTNLMSTYGIPGCSVVLVDGQDIVWAEGFGYADVDTQTPVTTNTTMMIGSVSKFITALMAAQLADDGALDLDASITNALPEFAMLDRFSGQIDGWTARSMLNHHSGVPGDIYNGSFGLTTYWPGYIDWLVEYFQASYPLYPPNLLASYCNSGFNLVGEMVARHDNVDYAEAAHNRIFDPLGMTHSSFYHDHPLVAANLATGYINGSPTPTMIGNMAATGGAFSRPVDMARIIQMVLANGEVGGASFLSPSILAEMGTATNAPLDFDHYFKPGLGLDSVADPAMSYAGRTWVKDGDTSTFSAFLEILPDRQLGVFVNFNMSHPARYALARFILQQALLERDGLTPPATPAVPESAVTNMLYADLQAWEGWYVTAAGVERILAQTNGLFACIADAANATNAVVLAPLANGRFARPDQPQIQYAFTNVSGRTLLLRYGTDGGLRDEFIYGGYAEKIHGTRYEPPAISVAWSNRLDTAWVADNVYHDDYWTVGAGFLPTFSLHAGNGILSIAGNSIDVLEPVADDLAFVAGLSTRGDASVRIATNATAQELLWFGGYRSRRMEDIPVLQNLVAVSASVGPHENGLFRYAPATTNASVSFVLSDGAAAAVVRVFNADAQLIAMGEGAAACNFDGVEGEVILSIASANPLELQIKAVDTTEPRVALRRTLETFPDLPGISVAAREPGFLPVVLAEGLAAVNPARPLEGHEQFHIASISKTFTAVAVFLLQQQGLLNITNTVDTYAPELDVPRGNEITVEHLLAHRSGLPDANNTAWIDGQLVKNRFRAFTVEQIVDVALHLYPDLMFEPGTDYHYSDTGYNILARVIENVSGTNYQAFVQQNVLVPLGLAGTFAPGNADISVPDPAIDAYKFLDGVFTDTSDWNPSVEFGCGSIVSTLEDLLAAAKGFFLATNLLQAGTQALMMDPLSPGAINTYGRGCNVQDGLGWGHDGMMWGMASIMRADPTNGVCLSGALNLQYEDERLFASFFHLHSAAALLKAAMGYSATPFGAEPPILFPILLPTRQGGDYHAQLVAFNVPTNWVIENLPAGLSYDPIFGTITGTTDAVGAHSITVTAQNAYGDVSATLTLEVHTSYANTIAAVSNAIVDLMAAEGTEGVSIALVDDQEVVWAQGFGYADREAGIRVDADTVFHIGSVSKALTSALAIQYAERGLLDLAAPFTNYVPAVEWKERFPAARPITVQDLMTHHSGLPGDLFRAGFVTRPLSRGYQEILADLARTYPVAEPGLVNNYCNVGFVLLEGVIEAAARSEGDFRSFDQLATARLFDILNMDASSYRYDKPAIIDRVAVSYVDGARMPHEYVDILGTGSMYSRPRDLAGFVKAVFAGGDPVLRPETLDRMLSDHSTNGLLDVHLYLKSGLGWDTVRDPRIDYAGPFAWKNGATFTQSAQMSLLPEKKLGVVICASSPSSIPMAIDALALKHALLERDGLSQPTNVVSWSTNHAVIAQSELDALAGVYAGHENYDIVESHPGSLTYRRNVPDGGFVLENLILRDDGWFLADHVPALRLAFTNTHGHALVLYEYRHSTHIEPGIFAEHFTPPVLSAAWSNRLNRTWYARNIPADDYLRLLGTMPTLALHHEDGVLRVEAGGVPANRALMPETDSLAWLPGVANRGDSAVQVLDIGGIEHLLYGGYVYGPAPEEIPAEGSVVGEITSAQFAQWHEIQPLNPPAAVGGVADVHYQVSLANAPTNFLLRVYQADGTTLVGERAGNGALDLVSGPDPLLLSVQPGSDGVQTGSYAMAFSVPLLVRKLALIPPDIELVWQGPTGSVVTVEMATNLCASVPFTPLATGITASNTLLRTTFPAGDHPTRFFRITE